MHALGDGGAIRDWLVSPAWRRACDDLGALLDADGSPWGEGGRWTLTQGPEVAPLKGRIYERRPLVLSQPLPQITEGGALSWTAPGGDHVDEGTWRRVHTHHDGLVDWSDFCLLPEYRHALAGTLIEVDQPEWRDIEIACTGPVAAWLGGDLLGSWTDVSYMEPVTHTVRARLGSGTTPLLIATWQVGFREVRHIARVAIGGLPVRVVIPSPNADERASVIAEAVLDSIAVRSWALPGGAVTLTGPAEAALRVNGRPVTLDKGRCMLQLAGGDAGPVEGSASMLGTGETKLTVAVDDDRCPVTRELAVAVLPDQVRAVPCGEPTQWRREVLDHVAACGPSVARALASGALHPEDLTSALYMVTNRADCADFEAVGLLNLWHKLPERDWPTDTRDQVRQALLGFKYWIDQPGLDAMCYFTENHQFVFHTAEILAGQAFPGETFSNTGWPGSQHAAHGRDYAMQWMKAKLAGGFSEFDSNAYLAIDSLALASLIEMADDEELTDAAEALLDKLLFTLAANSWHGIHGAAHGRSYVQTLRSSRFEETAPIMWALWGTGALNRAVLPATLLATATRYQLPGLIRSVATGHGGLWHGRQVYHGGYRFKHDLLSRPYGSDLTVWKTEHAMLSSVQDYRAGLPGLQEHVWGATLAPEVQVFATYPGSSSDSPSARPNAWAGQRVLPRVRQDRDTVLVAYQSATNLPTHVWFPAPLMDEVAIAGSWLAGRVGHGYVAVSCACGMVPVEYGHTAGQEWRPRGDGTAYVATVGSVTADGTFGQFVEALAEPEFTAGGASWSARDGRRLVLRGTQAFTVDGTAPDLDPQGRPDTTLHMDNPACFAQAGADRFEATHNGHRLVIDLAAARRIEPARAR